MNKKRFFKTKTALAFFMVLFSLWGWGQTLIYQLDLAAQSSAFGTSNTYEAKSGTVSGITWYLNAGSAQSTSAVWLGTNSAVNRNNLTKLSLGVNGRGGAIATALGIAPSEVGYYAIVGGNSITNVGSIKVKASATGGTAPATLWCLYTTDGGTSYNILSSISNPGTTEQTFTPPSTISSAQYAFVFYSSTFGTYRTPYFKFYEPTCTTSKFSFYSTTVNKVTGDVPFTNTFTTDNTSPTVYSSNNTGVATVNASSGEVTVVGAGNATISVTQIADGTHCAVSASYSLTVTSSSPQLAISGVPTDHGSSCPGIPNTAVQYTITNSGAATAAGLNVTSSDPQFVVSNLSSSTIAAGDSATFDVVFTPSSSGSKAATLTATSTGSNTATLALTGKGNAAVAGAVTTSAETNVGSIAVQLNGNLNTLGTCPATQEKGFVWGANANPTISDNSTTVSGVATGAYNYHITGLTANTIYHYRAYIKDADNNYIYGADRQFTTLAVADHLAFVNVPASGSVGNNLTSFTVEARRPDNSVDTFYTGNVILSKASGTGTLSGTLSQAFVNGVATFNDIQFSSVGNYSLHANHGTFAQITSAPIAIAAGPPPFTFVENFDYSNGELNGQGGWAFTASNTTPVINVVDGSITYPGYLSSGIGNEVSLNGSGQDVNKSFDEQTSGSIYASFLVNVSAAKTGGDYFFHLGPNPISTNYRGRVFVKSTTGGIQFGVSNAGTAVYSPTVYDLNTTYVVVLKYAINSTDTDAAEIYINPALNAPEPTTGWTASNDSSASTIGAVAIRQGGNNSAPSLLLDGIRVATKWEDIVGASTTTWNGNVWSNNNEGPDATMPAVIAEDYTGDSFEAKELTVNENITLTVPSNGYVKAGKVTNNGHIIVSNNGNFVQTGTFEAGADSTFKVNRTTKPVLRLDYNSWSSPMMTSTQKLSEFSPGTLPARFMTYNGGNYVPVADVNATFTPGQGYLIRTPNTYTSTTPVAFQGQFVGTVPNSGSVTYTPTGIDGPYVFLGNPYPSAISMADFAFANSSQMVTDTFYVWDSQTKMVDGVYSNPNYITHTAVGSNPFGSANFVPVGQGFFVDRGGNSGSFTFTNDMRRTSETGTFAKGPVSDKFWLQMVAPSGLKPQLLIAFTPDATAGYDAGFDGKMFENSGDAIYSTADSKSLVINALGTFSSTDIINVAANFTTAGNYTLSIAQKEGLFENGQSIYLKDHLTGIETDLTAGDYSFAGTAGLHNDRFTLSFSRGLLGNADVVKNDAVVYVKDQTVYVQASKKIATVEVFEMSGKMMKKAANINSQNAQLPIFYKGVALIKVLFENGETITRKIILN